MKSTMRQNHECKLKSLPLQWLETSDGIVMRRGCTQIKFHGHGASQVIRAILSETAQSGATLEEISAAFPPAIRPHLKQLVDRLISCRFLVPSDETLGPENGQESNLDVFYWHFGKSGNEVADTLNRLQLTVLGVNCISRQFARSLRASMVHHFKVIDVPALRNQRLFDDSETLLTHEWPSELTTPVPYDDWTQSIESTSLDCLIVTSDFGGMEHVQHWNRICVEQRWPLLPVVLQDLVGYVGPLVIPGETACYECLRARMNSHHDSPYQESTAQVEQSVVGFHPAMASMLGDLAAFEIIKVFGETLPNRKVGMLIEMKLLIPEVKTRRILKIPRCRVCSPLYSRASSASTKDLFTPISELNR